ncbi:unnamed protein product [Calypogeia fissa]
MASLTGPLPSAATMGGLHHALSSCARPTAVLHSTLAGIGGSAFLGVQIPTCSRRAQRNILVVSGGLGARASSVAGRHVIITGANSGIGKATALDLAKKGMVVTLACRNEESGKAAAREIAQGSNNASVRSMVVDLESLESVRKFAAEYKDTGLPLHVLVNNAGIMACPEAYTEDNFERQLGVNHLGHFLLTSLLLDNLVASASAEKKSRVVVLSSAAERIGEMDFTDLNYKGSRVYNNWGAYGQSKLANCLFSYELAKRSRKLGLPIISNAMHPGVVNTNLIRYVFPNVTRMGELPPPIDGLARSFFGLFGLKTPEEGASTAILLASAPEVENSSGLYFENCKEGTPSLNARNPRLASQLWDVSVELTGASPALEPLGLAKEKSTIA